MTEDEYRGRLLEEREAGHAYVRSLARCLSVRLFGRDIALDRQLMLAVRTDAWIALSVRRPETFAVVAGAVT